MTVSVIVLDDVNSDVSMPLQRLKRLFNDHNFTLNTCAVCHASIVPSVLAVMQENSDAIIAVNLKIEGINFSGESGESVCIDGKTYIYIQDFSEQSLSLAVNALSQNSKSVHTTYVFKTFGKTVIELKESLKEFLKNKNRIQFNFYPQLLECTITIRCSHKTERYIVDALIAGVTAAIKHCTYAIEDDDLPNVVAKTLTLQNKTLSIAESYTGGAVASSLIKIPGMSKILKEAMVCYSNESKMQRLNIEPQIIRHYGAVSIETVYEMAANLLLSSGSDLVVATTGNAGPTSEKPDEVGVCYLAVGDKNGIHIYKDCFKGDRENVIESGLKTALYQLYLLLTESELTRKIKEGAILEGAAPNQENI